MKAVKKYIEFNQLEPQDLRAIPGIPARAECVGKMVSTMYASKKWENKVNYYRHEHDEGVKLYFPKASGTAVPQSITGVKSMAKLGRCIGLEYVDHEGNLCEAVGNKNTELYCIPSGKALVVVNGNKVEAIIWGGRLAVRAAGIDH